MRAKLAKIDELRESGFSIDEITSEGTLDIHLSCGEATVTIRFDKEEIARLWPELFPGEDEPDRPKVALPQPTPYGARDVAAFLQLDDARSDRR